MNARAIALSDLIDSRREEIAQRWLDRVRTEVARGADVEPTALRDGIGDYLQKIVELLRDRPIELHDAESRRAWAGVAHEHGVTRIRHGFDIIQLVNEFAVLRDVIEAVALEARLLSMDALIRLTRIIDAATATAVGAYVEARDYEARQRQAENVGFMTHELKTPLAAAILTAQRLRREVPPAHHALCDRLDRNHERLRSLIDGVLLTHKLDADKIEVSLESMRLGDLMERATAAAQAAAEAKGVAFHTQWSPDVMVRVDPELAHAAIQNVVGNAVKYTDDGDVHVSVEDAGDRVVVHVRDNCDGLSLDELRTIFEPFRRGVTRKEGTGLGLAIARRALEALGGTIDAESHEGRGCHFWLVIRKGTEAAVADEHAAPPVH